MSSAPPWPPYYVRTCGFPPHRKTGHTGFLRILLESPQTSGSGLISHRDLLFMQLINYDRPSILQNPTCGEGGVIKALESCTIYKSSISKKCLQSSAECWSVRTFLDQFDRSLVSRVPRQCLVVNLFSSAVRISLLDIQVSVSSVVLPLSLFFYCLFLFT